MQSMDSEKKAGPSPSFPNPNPNSTRNRPTRLTLLLSTIIFIATLLLLTVSVPPTVRNKLAQWLNHETPGMEWDQSGAQGDEYLLGVGKADITGYIAYRLILIHIVPVS